MVGVDCEEGGVVGCLPTTAPQDNHTDGNIISDDRVVHEVGQTASGPDISTDKQVEEEKSDQEWTNPQNVTFVKFSLLNSPEVRATQAKVTFRQTRKQSQRNRQ